MKKLALIFRRYIGFHKCRFIVVTSSGPLILPLALGLANVLVTPALADPPGIVWHYTNAAGTVFAADSQTNVYVNRGGTVVVFNSAGVPVQTNAICPVPGIARRDAAGNFYFAGTFAPPVDFGGVTLATNSCFLAKYTSGGSLLWAGGFVSSNVITGSSTANSPHALGLNLNVGDLQVEPGGVAYVSAAWVLSNDRYSYNNYVLRFDAGGANTWETATVDAYSGQFYEDHEVAAGGALLGGATAAGCYAISTAFNSFEYDSILQVFRGAAMAARFSAWEVGGSTPVLNFAGVHPVADSAGNVYDVEHFTLYKRDAIGAVIWSAAPDLGGAAHTVAPDLLGGVHLADAVGTVARFDSSGNPAWEIALSSQCNSMIVDSRGNRFISVTDGGLYALQPEPFAGPVITNAPRDTTVMSGDTLTLSVGASGGAPLGYYWWFGNSPIVGATNATLSLAGITSAQAGAYSVIVSNPIGSVTSAPVAVRIKNVELFAGNQLLANGTYYFATNQVLTLRSQFTNGASFYTLDGSTPGFLSSPYSGAITITSNVTVAAIGYSADFSQSEFADTVNIVLPPKYTFTATTLGGGTVTLNPPGTGALSNSIVYLSNAVATVTANAASGWSFLRWTGAAGGTNPTISVTMTQDAAVQAVFGTTLATTVAGNGQVIVYPAGGLYPYGSVVRLQGLPGAGSYFGIWGNAGSGAANPLYFTMTNANPAFSSIFGLTTANQAALTVLISGHGQVGVNPSGNVFTPGQQLTLTATPNAGASFLHWSGDASGTQNPLTLTLNQSEVIAVNFTGETATLSAALSGQTSAGFTFTLTSDPGSIYQILVSTNLDNWQNVGSVTNITGQTQFTDVNPAGAPTRFYRAAQ